MNNHAVVLAAMSNHRRLAILTLLEDSELAVNAIAEAVQISQSALSQHLAKLRSAKLVSTRRAGQTIYYTIASPYVAAVLAALRQVETLGQPLSSEILASFQTRRSGDAPSQRDIVQLD